MLSVKGARAKGVLLSFEKNQPDGVKTKENNNISQDNPKGTRCGA
jgi:hypothetical protein